MVARKGLIGVAVGVLALLALLATGAPAEAARLRYHFAVVDDRGAVILQPVAGAPGERLTWSGRWEPYNCPPPRPTCMVPFKHAFTGQALVLPLGLPAGTPQMEHRFDRTIVYNYGSYTVEVHFIPDGTVNVVYNSGLLRAP
jgi:hypothetical protein